MQIYQSKADLHREIANVWMAGCDWSNYPVESEEELVSDVYMMAMQFLDEKGRYLSQYYRDYLSKEEYYKEEDGEQILGGPFDGFELWQALEDYYDGYNGYEKTEAPKWE